MAFISDIVFCSLKVGSMTTHRRHLDMGHLTLGNSLGGQLATRQTHTHHSELGEFYLHPCWQAANCTWAWGGPLLQRVSRVQVAASRWPQQIVPYRQHVFNVWIKTRGETKLTIQSLWTEWTMKIKSACILCLYGL